LKPRRDSTSGYRGVSWHKKAQKWGAYIRRDDVRHYLGLFDTAEEAHAAYIGAAARLSVDRPDPRLVVLDAVRALYTEHGPEALATPFLAKAGIAPKRLRGVGLKHADLIEQLDLTDKYARWREREFRYGGKLKSRLTWETTVEEARALLADDGADLPTVQWCRLNGYSQLTAFVHQSGRTWEDLRAAIGLPPSVRYFDSRIGIRWRSRPEACLSNFLYARGVEHRIGERYPDSYSIQSGRAYGRYDMHFISKSGSQIDVEIWGDIPDAYSHGRYGVTRAKKEAWHNGRADFLGLHYIDCLSETRLIELLKPYIGVIEPFRFDKPQDHLIETAHWSDADELLESCRAFAKQRSDGIFPGNEWLRKRGRYVDRPGEAYNTLAGRVDQWLGGTRNVRRLLGQGHASTTRWTVETVTVAWQKFESQHGLTPTHCKGAYRSGASNQTILAEGARIYEAARRLGAIDQARDGTNRAENKVDA